MLKIERPDGTMRFINLDRVIVISPHAEEGLVVRFRNAKDEVANERCTRFQVIKQGTWYD